MAEQSQVVRARSQAQEALRLAASTMEQQTAACSRAVSAIGRGELEVAASEIKRSIRGHRRALQAVKQAQINSLGIITDIQSQRPGGHSEHERSSQA